MCTRITRRSVSASSAAWSSFCCWQGGGAQTAACPRCYWPSCTWDMPRSIGYTTILPPKRSSSQHACHGPGRTWWTSSHYDCSYQIHRHHSNHLYTAASRRHLHCILTLPVDTTTTGTRSSNFVVVVMSLVVASKHFQSVLVVEFVADLEWPVLGWVPEVCRPLLYLNSQTVKLAVG